MKLRLFTLLIVMLTCCNYSFAAFPVISHIEAATDNHLTVVTQNSVTTEDTLFKKTTYRNQPHKPYHNREKEAKLAFTFGILGLLVFPAFGVVALILGIMSADRRNKYFSRAKWGIILGAYSTLQVILIAAIIIAFTI
ncbi:DUF4190 domain-containing protein [Flavipsychrobacter stenotrophus]|nr:DUF4190 domain-containing protein [Flavipsychrobacter stenotrophus]